MINLSLWIWNCYCKIICNNDYTTVFSVIVAAGTIFLCVKKPSIIGLVRLLFQVRLLLDLNKWIWMWCKFFQTESLHYCKAAYKCGLNAAQVQPKCSPSVAQVQPKCGPKVAQIWNVNTLHTYVEGSLGGKKITWAKVFKLCYYDINFTQNS